ncbi:unnamed protein product [Closterium sp. Naga37s-1]|nr:unnamed protein product [Closterium sp. Naga37s-1]CAI5535601.1 unnamed protein product [Closterium sp. Naga37s-1]
MALPGTEKGRGETEMGGEEQVRRCRALPWLCQAQRKAGARRRWGERSRLGAAVPCRGSARHRERQGRDGDGGRGAGTEKGRGETEMGGEEQVRRCCALQWLCQAQRKAGARRRWGERSRLGAAVPCRGSARHRERQGRDGDGGRGAGYSLPCLALSLPSHVLTTLSAISCAHHSLCHLMWSPLSLPSHVLTTLSAISCAHHCLCHLMCSSLSLPSHVLTTLSAI